MALTIGGGGRGGGAGTRYGGHQFLRRPIVFPQSSSNPPFWSLQYTARNPNVIARAAKKLSSRSGKFDSKNRRSLSTTTKEQEQEQEQQQRTVQIETDDSIGGRGSVDVSDGVGDDGYFLPELPGEKPDFWEGTQWDTFGFVVQYLWAFGIVFALIACGIAVSTYNEGATDFKATPAYKESIQSRELLEEPEGSNSDVFESNPTEEAPSLE